MKKPLLKPIKTFDIYEVIPKWWNNEQKSAKVAFLSALVIGFVTHIFIYTGRYYGNHDIGMVTHTAPTIANGRWLNTLMLELNLGYVLPLMTGIFITFFFAVSAFLICKLLEIEKSLNGFLIGAILTTFPSISNTNLYLNNTLDFHFGAMVAVIAAYITVKYRRLFWLGSILMMCSLAIYQSKFNLALGLLLFILLKQLLHKDYTFVEFRKQAIRILFTIGLSGLIYVISIPISVFISKVPLGGHRGASYGNMYRSFLTIEGFTSSVKQVYYDFYLGFFGKEYIITDTLKVVYILLGGLFILFLSAIIIRQRIHIKPGRMALIGLLIILIPMALNFADFVNTGNMVSTFMYAFSLIFVLIITLSEDYSIKEVLPLAKSVLVICILFITIYYTIINNIYYLQAYYINQRTNSFTTRLLTQIDPLITETELRQIAFFGGMPNESYYEVPETFGKYKANAPSLGHHSFMQMQDDDEWRHNLFITNIQNLHGVNLTALPHNELRDAIYEKIRIINMPIWPAEGSIAVIDDVIVINFGLKIEP